MEETYMIKRNKRALIGVALAGVFLALAACSSPEQRLEKFVTSGDSYLEKGRIGAANVQFLNALKIDDQNVRALKGLVKVAEARREYNQMYGLLQRLNRINPEDVKVRLDLAKLNLLGNDAAAALDLVNDVLSEEPQNYEALAVKAAVQFRLGNRTEAVSLANKALAIHPNSEDAIAILASARIQEGDDAGALKFLEESIAKNSKATILGLMRIQLLEKMGRSSELDTAYKNLIATDPKNINFRRLYVASLMKAEKFGDARAELAEIARLAPKDRDAKLDVVRIDFRMGGKAKAEKTLENYIRENPDDVDLKFALGVFLVEQKDYAKAETLYRGVIERQDAELSDIVRAKNQIAALRLLEGRDDEARKLIDEVLAADAKDPDALMKRAGLEIKDRKFDRAIADLRVVVTAKPDGAQAHMLLASAFVAQGDFNLAESELVTAVEKSNRGALESNVLAKFLMRRGKKDRAENVLIDAIAVNPSSVDNLKLLAAIRLDKQDWSGAEEIANSLKSISDDDADVSAILGAAYAGLKDYAGAIDVLKEENEKAPLAARPLANLVAVYLDAGRAADAAALLNNTIENNPESYEPRILLSEVQRRSSHLGEAKETLRSAIDVDPLRSDAYIALFDIYRREGRLNDAAMLIDQATSAIPNDDALQMLKADAAIALKKPDVAIGIYETILARRPRDLIVSNNLASLLAERDDQETIERAAKIAGPLKGVESPFYQDTYGWALYRAGQKDEGLAALEKAVKMEPNLVDARYHLGVALMEMGQAERGKTELEAVISKAPNSAFAADAKKRLGS